MSGRCGCDHDGVRAGGEQSLRAFHLIGAERLGHAGSLGLVDVHDGETADERARFQTARVKTSDPPRPHQANMHLPDPPKGKIPEFGNVPTGTFPPV